MNEIEEHLNYLKSWLDNFKKASKIYPQVYKAYEMAKFKNEVINNTPDHLDKIIIEKLFDEFSYGIDYWQNLPRIEGPISSFDINTGITYSVSGSTGGYGILNELQKEEDEIGVWASKYCSKYEEIQNNQDRINHIVDELDKLNPDLKDEFRKSVEAYEKYKNDLISQQELGILIRNVLEHHKGELYNRALTIVKSIRPSAQKIKKWNEMANELAKNGVGSHEYNLLINEGNNYTSLHNTFTYMQKNIAQFDKNFILGQKSLFLDYLFNISNLIDGTKI